MSKITIREFFQQNYIDTKKITQKFIDTYKGKVTGRKPLNVKEVCVGDLTFEHNGRTPKAIDVMNYISKEGGLNWYMLGVLKLARLNGRLNDVADGLHRAIQTCIVLGPDAMVPVTETEFDTSEQIHGCFWKSHSRAKTVNNEANHVAQIRSGEPEKENFNIDKMLKKIGNTVVYEDDDRFEPTQNKPEWSVMVGPLKQILKDVKNDTDTVTTAIKLYQKAFAHTYSEQAKPYGIVGQINQAFAYLLIVNKEWFEGEYKNISNLAHFEEFLIGSAKMRPNKKDWFYRHYMADRMEKKYQGTAMGIWTEFCSWFTNSVGRGGGRPTGTMLDNALKGKIFVQPTEDKEGEQKAA